MGGVIFGAIFVLSGLLMVGFSIYVLIGKVYSGIEGLFFGVLLVLGGAVIVSTTSPHIGTVYDVSNFTKEDSDKQIYDAETKEVIKPEKPMKRIVIQYENNFYLMETEKYENSSLKKGDDITFYYGEVETVEIASGGN